MTSEYTQQVAQIAGPLEAAMDAMAGTLSANQEVVLHNLTTPEHSIIKIINGHVSGRGNGDHLLAGPEKDTGFALLLQKTNNNKPRTIKPSPLQGKRSIAHRQFITAKRDIRLSPSVLMSTPRLMSKYAKALTRCCHRRQRPLRRSILIWVG